MKALAVIFVSLMIASCTKEDITPASEKRGLQTLPAPHLPVANVHPVDSIDISWNGGAPPLVHSTLPANPAEPKEK